MFGLLAFALAAVFVIVGVHLLANRTGLPAAALLTVAGVIYAYLPGPNVELNPEVVMTFVVPPLLYSAALNSSLSAIRRNLRPVISLSVALVLATALVTGASMAALVPQVSLAAAIALGAAVAPPDPVAALAIGRRAGLPARVITIIEGEGLLNDATALTTFTVAVSAATSGTFSLGTAALRFVATAAGGLAVGYAVAYAARLVRRVVGDPVLVNSVSLGTPFLAYLVGEELHVSGVLAVVVAGLVVGHDTPRFTSGASRLQTGAVWRLADFLLEGFVFLLVGQQLDPVLRGLHAYQPATVLAAVGITLGTVLLLRPLWLALTQLLPKALHTRLGGADSGSDRPLTGREILVLGWAGTRGVITLAAIFSLPLSTPGRNLLLFCAYLVVLVTLLGQGLTFTLVVRGAGVRADPADAARVRNQARVAAAGAGLARLDELTGADAPSVAALAVLRNSLIGRLHAYQRRLDLLDAAEGGEVPVSPELEAALNARRAVIDAQREELLRWRDAGRLPDTSLRILERELDHEEHALPARPTH